MFSLCANSAVSAVSAAVLIAAITPTAASAGDEGRRYLERLTGYQADLIFPTERPNATDPKFFKSLPYYRVPEVVKLYYEPGGNVFDHYSRFRAMAHRNNFVEIHSACVSACTIVVSEVSKDHLCFGPDAQLKFHQARSPSGEARLDTTENMYWSYPDDIRAWIGGWKKIPYNGFLYLTAPELWKMGYRKCPR
jgi:hypothetical protein